MANSDPDRAAEAVLRKIVFGKDGLVPAVAQQHDTGEVLMVAWMNHDAILETLKTGHAVYWSRSRQRRTVCGSR